MSTSTSEQAAPQAQEIPKVAELGTTSAPLKSAAFFLGAYCKEYNGAFDGYLFVVRQQY
jgi:NADH dehydrogenase (ubiquinone) 1 alpha subcomplex subunit 8